MHSSWRQENLKIMKVLTAWLQLTFYAHSRTESCTILSKRTIYIIVLISSTGALEMVSATLDMTQTTSILRRVFTIQAIKLFQEEQMKRTSTFFHTTSFHIEHVCHTNLKQTNSERAAAYVIMYAFSADPLQDCKSTQEWNMTVEKSSSQQHTQRDPSLYASSRAMISATSIGFVQV